MTDATDAVVILSIGTVVLFTLLILCVFLATRPQHKED